MWGGLLGAALVPRLPRADMFRPFRTPEFGSLCSQVGACRRRSSFLATLGFKGERVGIILIRLWIIVLFQQVRFTGWRTGIETNTWT